MDATHACVAQNPLGVHPSKEVHTAADGQPNEEVVTSTPPSLSIKVQPANPSDSPDLVVLELTTFVNDPISQHMKPLRPQLLQSGVAPEQWPDYQAMLRRRHRSIVNGEIVFKAVIPIEGGRADTKGKIVGMAHMVPPKRLRRKVSVKDRVWSSLLHPTYEGFRWFMPDEAKANGGDEVFAERFRTMIARTREEVMNGREHFALNFLFVSTQHARSGIGSALLKRCTRLADAAHIPIILESTPMAIALYEKHGFKTVRTSKIVYMGPEDVVEWPVMVREPIGGYVEGGEAGETDVDVDSLASD